MDQRDTPIIVEPSAAEAPQTAVGIRQSGRCFCRAKHDRHCWARVFPVLPPEFEYDIVSALFSSPFPHEFGFHKGVPQKEVASADGWRRAFFWCSPNITAGVTTAIRMTVFPRHLFRNGVSTE
jgi:hypothetical protein